jgi:hypothetical protein
VPQEYNKISDVNLYYVKKNNSMINFNKFNTSKINGIEVNRILKIGNILKANIAGGGSSFNSDGTVSAEVDETSDELTIYPAPTIDRRT